MSTSGQSDLNPFEVDLQQLARSSLPAPPSYLYRIVAQMVLCGTLMVVSLVYIILHCLYTKRSGAPLWLFRFQKNNASSGRFSGTVMVNSLMTFAILAFLTSSGQLGSRFHNWMVYVKHRPSSKLLISQMLPWVPSFVQAWFFSVTNLRATWAARQSHVTRYKAVLHPMVYNIILLGFPVAYVIAVTMFVFFASSKQDRITDATMVLSEILREASARYAAGMPPSPRIAERLTQATSSVLKQTELFQRSVVQLCSTAMALCALIGLMNIFNLCLVCTLLSNAKFIKRKSNLTVLASGHTGISTLAEALETSVLRSHPDCNYQQDEIRFDRKKSSPTVLPGPYSKNPIVISPVTVSNPQDIAMRRLAADLAVAIPCVLVMTVTMTVTMAILVRWGFESTTWVMQEFIMDSFCYTYTIIILLALVILTINLVKAWRTQRASGPLTSSSASVTSLSNPMSSNCPSIQLRLPTEEDEKTCRHGSVRQSSDNHTPDAFNGTND